MGQLISPTTPDYRLYYAREVPVPPNHPRPIHISIGTFHLPPIQVVLTRYQSEYILMLRFEFNMDFEDISWRVNQLWRRKGIRMSPQHVSDILAQAKEEARDFEDHPYHFYSNRSVTKPTLIQKRDQRPNKKITAFPEVFLQQCADTNRKALAPWYNAKLHTPDLGPLKPDTIAILKTWETEPLVPGTREHQLAKIRTLRDIIFEKFQGSNTAIEELAASKPTVQEMSEAHQCYGR
ncbi:MAG: hypothetical protein L6R38_006126 [Xanthoria sp. 2 TBL-2021]|nr:MAG: hypothetical protein L6R38_006126 [Xanthoria sp. 2 TBL-2021]